MLCKNCHYYDKANNKCLMFGTPTECEPDEYCFTSKERPIFEVIACCGNCANYDDFNNECMINCEVVNKRDYCEMWEMNKSIFPLLKNGLVI